MVFFMAASQLCCPSAIMFCSWCF